MSFWLALLAATIGLVVVAGTIWLTNQAMTFPEDDHDQEA